MYVHVVYVTRAIEPNRVKPPDRTMVGPVLARVARTRLRETRERDRGAPTAVGADRGPGPRSARRGRRGRRTAIPCAIRNAL